MDTPKPTPTPSPIELIHSLLARVDVLERGRAGVAPGQVRKFSELEKEERQKLFETDKTTYYRMLQAEVAEQNANK